MPFNINLSLKSLIDQQLPADLSAGSIFRPVEGLSSESWHISAGRHQWLARLSSPEKQRLGIDRRREYRLLRHLAQTEIAPEVKCWAAPWLVVNWVEGETLAQNKFFASAAQQQLAAMLVSLHHQRPLGDTLVITRRFEIYWQSIDSKRLTPAWLRLHKKMLKARLPKTVKIAVAHMDIHPQNWVDSPHGARLIDWEYAIATDIALEFAALFAGNDYSVEQQKFILQRYVQRGGYRDDNLLARRIHQWRPWLEYLMLMWFEVRWQQTGEARYIEWAQPLRDKLLKNIK